MGYRYDVYIGSDNSSHRIEEDNLAKVIDWARSAFPKGYTIIRARGYFDGVQEESLLLSLLTDKEIDIRQSIPELKRVLNQSSVLVSKQAVETDLL